MQIFIDLNDLYAATFIWFPCILSRFKDIKNKLDLGGEICILHCTINLKEVNNINASEQRFHNYSNKEHPVIIHLVIPTQRSHTRYFKTKRSTMHGIVFKVK